MLISSIKYCSYSLNHFFSFCSVWISYLTQTPNVLYAIVKLKFIILTHFCKEPGMRIRTQHNEKKYPCGCALGPETNKQTNWDVININEFIVITSHCNVVLHICWQQHMLVTNPFVTSRLQRRKVPPCANGLYVIECIFIYVSSTVL